MTELDKTLAAAQRGTMGAGAEAGGSDAPTKLTNKVLDAKADAEQSKTEKSFERVSARADKDTARRVA